MDDQYNIESDIAKLWEQYQVRPDYLQIELGALKSLCGKHPPKPYVDIFLNECEIKGIPDTAIAVLTSNQITLLVDDNGNLLAFQ